MSCRLVHFGGRPGFWPLGSNGCSTAHCASVRSARAATGRVSTRSPGCWSFWSTNHCCQAMTNQLNWRCDQHQDAFDCPDALVVFTARFQEYGLVIHDGGSSVVTIKFCPWCGRRLPDSQRDRWCEELQARGIEPWGDDIPAELQDGRWLNPSPDSP